MSTRASFFHAAFAPDLTQADSRESQAFSVRPVWDAGRFADEQIRRLVRQVFFPGWPRPAHHVAFAAVDEKTDTAAICMRVGEILHVQAPGNICIVDANPSLDASLPAADGVAVLRPGGNGCESLREQTQRISSRLWHMPHTIFFQSNEQSSGTSGLETQMSRLRAAFDYTAIHVPPAGLCNDAVLLGQLSDGVVLIVEANSTRRAAAQKVKEILQAANVRLMGTVLNGRTFPIPHGIYHKL